MTACNFCGRKVKRSDVAAMNMAGTVGMSLGGLLLALEIAAAAGADDEDVEEGYRLARNGAGISKALHEAAHGDYVMASQLYPNVEGWLDLVLEIVEGVKSEDLTGWEAACEASLFDFSQRARWMVDNATFNARGEVVLPDEGGHGR